MQEKKYKVVIVGGGTAGLTVASKIAARFAPGELAVIEPAEKHFYQPLWTLVVNGIFPREVSALDEQDCIPESCGLILGFVSIYCSRPAAGGSAGRSLARGKVMLP